MAYQHLQFFSYFLLRLIMMFMHQTENFRRFHRFPTLQNQITLHISLQNQSNKYNLTCILFVIAVECSKTIYLTLGERL